MHTFRHVHNNDVLDDRRRGSLTRSLPRVDVETCPRVVGPTLPVPTPGRGGVGIDTPDDPRCPRLRTAGRPGYSTVSATDSKTWTVHGSCVG